MVLVAASIVTGSSVGRWTGASTTKPAVPAAATAAEATTAMSTFTFMLLDLCWRAAGAGVLPD